MAKNKKISYDFTYNHGCIKGDYLNIRIGNGYDVHKLVENRDLILGGVKIEHNKGLLGHSDADVLVHSIIDSLIGALNLGDIGTLFPDDNSKYKNISSLKLLSYVNKLLMNKNFYILNIDSVLVAQNPKLNIYIPNMKENISKCLNINIEQISIKATTEEHLGFTGQELGISSYAVCLINKKLP